MINWNDIDVKGKTKGTKKLLAQVVAMTGIRKQTLAYQLTLITE